MQARGDSVAGWQRTGRKVFDTRWRCKSVLSRSYSLPLLLLFLLSEKFSAREFGEYRLRLMKRIGEQANAGVPKKAPNVGVTKKIDRSNPFADTQQILWRTKSLTSLLFIKELLYSIEDSVKILHRRSERWFEWLSNGLTTRHSDLNSNVRFQRTNLRVPKILC